MRSGGVPGAGAVGRVPGAGAVRGVDGHIALGPATTVTIVSSARVSDAACASRRHAQSSSARDVNSVNSVP